MLIDGVVHCAAPLTTRS